MPPVTKAITRVSDMAEPLLPSFKKMIMRPGYGHKPETYGLDWYSKYIASRLDGYKSAAETRDSDEAKRRAENMRSSQDYPTGFDVPRENYTFYDRLEEEVPEGEEIKETDLVPYSERAAEAAEDYTPEGPEAVLDAQYYRDHPDDPEAQAYLRGRGIIKSIPSFREMMDQRIAKKIRGGTHDEYDDQFELYLNMYPEKRKELEDNASLIGGPMAMRIARDNAMSQWIKENRKAMRDAETSSGASAGSTYNQGVESGKGLYGAGIRPDGSYI